MADFSPLREAPGPQVNSPRPPLRIHHFLIWTALTAAIIFGCMTFDRWARNGPPIEDRITIFGLVLGAVAIAGALTIVGCGFYWRRSGVTFPKAPGDWLLTIIAVSVAVFFIAFVLFFGIFLTFGDDDWFVAFFGITSVPALIVWLRVHWLAIKRYADTTMWRIFFWVLMLSPFATGPGARLLRADVFAVIACVIWATCVDWHKHIPRNWTHWCGVACVVSIGISLLCVFALWN